MPMDEHELAPGDGLTDLVHVARDIAAERLDAPAGWTLLVSERERRGGDPENTHTINPYSSFDIEECSSREAARRRAHELLAPGRAWRAAVVWRSEDEVLIDAQEAEEDAVAGRFTVPVVRRRRLLRTLDPELGEVGVPSAVAALRPPSWKGATWTLRSGGHVVAELHVDTGDAYGLWAQVEPRAGLEAILPSSPFRQEPIGDWSLHRPTGEAIDRAAAQLQLNREQASWAWTEPPA